MAVGTQSYASADRVAIGFRADQFHGDPVTLWGVISQEARTIVAVVHEEFDAAVVVKICGGQAVAIESSGNAGACLQRHIFEFAVTLIPIEQFSLAEGAEQAFAFDFGIHVAIHDENIRPAVIIHIHEERPQPRN